MFALLSFTFFTFCLLALLSLTFFTFCLLTLPSFAFFTLCTFTLKSFLLFALCTFTLKSFLFFALCTFTLKPFLLFAFCLFAHKSLTLFLLTAQSLALAHDSFTLFALTYHSGAFFTLCLLAALSLQLGTFCLFTLKSFALRLLTLFFLNKSCSLFLLTKNLSTLKSDTLLLFMLNSGKLFLLFFSTHSSSLLFKFTAAYFLLLLLTRHLPAFFDLAEFIFTIFRYAKLSFRFYFDAGEDTLEDMIASVKHGYLLEGVESGMEDPKHWGIQCIVKAGREIRDGKLTGRLVAPIIMTGSVPELLGNISMRSRECGVFGTGGCGKGYKEWVKVSDGGPYLKTKARLG